MVGSLLLSEFAKVRCVGPLAGTRIDSFGLNNAAVRRSDEAVSDGTQNVVERVCSPRDYGSH